MSAAGNNRPPRPQKSPVRHGVEDNTRLNALNDGVFAIVITLLVLEISVPDVPSEQLIPALQALLPKVVSHVFSFIVLGIYWVGHHNMFLHIRRHDRVLLWLNILFLLFVASMPFPTAMIIRHGNQQISVIIYAATLALAGLSLDLIWWYATHNRRLVDADMAPELISFVHRRVLTAPIIYIATIPVSFISLDVAKLLVILVAFLYIVPNPLDQHHHREVGRRTTLSREVEQQIEEEPF